ncbi:MAG TPA: ScpA family protein [Acidimicrobiia bacterium]|nr:ScpA family protein [Acidimicrobiia bacterium]
MSYEVQTPVFEGPFDLLLHLILKEEVDLWEIQLERIVDAFVSEVEKMERLDLEVTTEFLLIAATLVDLKARRLLPGRDDVDIDEELLRFEERDFLIARLLECKTFQDAAKVLHDQLVKGSQTVARTVGPEEPFRSLAPDPLEQLPLEALLKAARKGLAPKAEPVTEVDTYHVAPIRASVRDAIETVLALLPERGAVGFRELTYGVDEKLEVIVRFLAVLELFKQGIVDLEQVENFSDLTVRPLAAGERVALDLSSLEEWGDDEVTPLQHIESQQANEQAAAHIDLVQEEAVEAEAEPVVVRAASTEVGEYL